MQMVRRASVFILLLLASCGSDGGSPQNTSVSQPTNPSDSQSPDLSESLNPGLPGTFFFEDVSGQFAVNLDLATGVETEAPRSRWRDLWPWMESDAYYDVVPQRFKRGELALSFGVCDFNQDDCIGIQSADGEIPLNVDDIELTIDEPAQLSHDGRFLAVITIDSARDNFLEIYSRDGALVFIDRQRFRYDLDYFVWLPDGRIVLLSEDRRTFLFTPPYSPLPATQVSFSDEFRGIVTSFDASPDGKRIAFSLARPHEGIEGFNRDLYTLNLDTQRIRLVATPAVKSDFTDLKRPKWSFDGKWISVQDGGYSTGPFLPEPGGYLFAVPTDHPTPLKVSRFNAERSPEVKIIRRIQFGAPDAQWVGGDYYWRPSE